MMPFLSQKLIMDLDLNVGSLLVTNFLGDRNLLKIFSCKKFMITSFVALFVGIASSHLVNKSLAVKIHLC